MQEKWFDFIALLSAISLLSIATGWMQKDSFIIVADISFIVIWAVIKLKLLYTARKRDKNIKGR